MTFTNVLLGLAVGSVSLYAGFGCAAKSRGLCDGLTRLHPVLGYAMQILIGLQAGALIGIVLTKARILAGLPIPDGADPEFPGSMFGVSTFLVLAGLLVAHLAFAAFVRRAVAKQ